MITNSSTSRQRLGFILMAIAAVLAATVLLLLDPIPQDVNYHRFADTREIFSIPNFWDVASSLPFLVVGCLGLYKLLVSRSLTIIDEARSAYVVFFAAVALVSFGSAYYHLWPDNQTLVLDRLPMTVAFMALCAIVVSEHVSVAAGRAMLWPMIMLGLLSVAYWRMTELNGAGDLRLYAFVQFFPMLALPIMFICFRSRFSGLGGYIVLLLAYALAKVFEHFDAAIFSALGFISGHSLKHIIVAMGIYYLIAAYAQRGPKGAGVNA